MIKFTQQEDMYIAIAVNLRIDWLMRQMESNRETIAMFPELAEDFVLVQDIYQREMDVLVSAVTKVSALTVAS